MADLRRAYALITRAPLLLVMPAILHLAGAAALMGALRWLLQWAMYGWVLGQAGGLAAGVAAMVCAPATASLYNAAILAAISGQPLDFNAALGGFGRHYTRILGGGMLAFAGASLAGALLGPDQVWALWLAAAAGSALAHLWFAVVIIGGYGILAATAKAVRELVRRPGDYLPMLSLAAAVGVLVPLAAGPWLITSRPAPEGLWSSVASLAAGMPAVAIAALVRVAVFSAYHRTRQV